MLLVGPDLWNVCLCSLDLDAWINEPPSESESEDEQPKAIFTKEEPKHSRPRHTEVDEKELARVSWPMIVVLVDITRIGATVLCIFKSISVVSYNLMPHFALND